MTKEQLIEQNKELKELNRKLRNEVLNLSDQVENSYTENHLDAKYDQGYDAGYKQGSRWNGEELSEHTLKSFGDNILKLG